MEEWNFASDAYYETGAIIKVGTKNFKVTKVTRSAIAVERYYWFDAAYDWIVRKVQAWGQK